MSKDITFIAKTNFRNSGKKFGIKRADRRQHMYVIGKTGVGKTAFLKNMALQDINNGQGLAIIDPHGEFVEEVLDNIPPHRINDVVYFNPADMEYPVSFNIMDVKDPKYKHLIASGLIGIFTKIWANVWSARMEYILANCILALLDTPGTTLLGVPRMLVDRDYRQKIVNNLKDPVVKSFWVNEYEEWDPRYRNEAIAPVQNKVGQFLNVSFVRNIVGQAKNTIDVDEIMNNQKILLVNVSKGRIGEDNAAILGAMIITKIQLSAMERVRIPEDERKDFYMYVDEFQNFATDSFVNILSEARKYRLDLIIAHQYIGQLVTDTSTAVRDAVFGNVGTMISFRVGASDAEALELEFTPEFLQTDLIRLDNYHIYLKLMIDGITSRPFSATTIAPDPFIKDDKKRSEIIRISRSKYATSVIDVEEEINNWAANQDQSRDGGQQKNKNLSKNNASQGRVQADGKTLYDAVCSECGKDTKVIFPPTEGRAVYCKSCLKKIKSKNEGNQSKPTVSEREISNTPNQVSRVGRDSDKDKALADLGIEFGPASTQGGSSSSSREQWGRVSFNPRKKEGGEKKGGSKKQHKEINLSELKKALEESLAPLEVRKTQDKHKESKPLTGLDKKDAPEQSDTQDYKPKNSKEELKQRIEEEKKEDETYFPIPREEQ
jgi:CxxC-x17-CxxC domain-containing protein